MITGLQILGLCIAVGSLAYFRVKPLIWAVGVAALLLLFGVFSTVPWLLLALAWIVFLPAALVFNVPQIRERLFMRKTFAFFKKQLPAMSQTEREALDAGDVWWEAELFQGRPSWKRLHEMPEPTLSEEEQAFIAEKVDTVCAMVDDWKIVHNDLDMPEPVWAFLKKEGFFGMAIDKKYGGLGFSALAQSTVVTKLATRSISVAVNTMVPNSLGPAELIYHYGTDNQKNYYLPRLACGDEVPCFALTAPEAGSDAGAISDHGIVCEGEFEGKTVLGIRLNWDKRYITLAPKATVVGLAFKLFDPEALLGEQKELGITLGLVPSTHPGVEIGMRHLPLNMAFLNGPVRGEDVFIPLDWIIGGRDYIGQGWRMMMECLAMGRGISLPAISMAVGKLGYRMTGAYARIRHQFNISIGRFEGIEEALGRIGGYTYMMEACRSMTAGAIDTGIKPAVVSAIAKYHMTEWSRIVMNDAMDIHAGRGIQLGPRNYIGTGYQGIPVGITVEGANILTRNLIIFGQGAIRCHPYIQEEMAAVHDEKDGFKRFDKALCSHLGYTVSNCVRSLWLGLTGARFVKRTVSDPSERYYRQLTRMSASLAWVADFAMMILGGDLKRKERLSARLGDVLSYLYMGSAVLKYYEDKGKQFEDLTSVHWCLQTCLYHIQHAFDEFFKNFPNAGLGKLLRFTVFPWGRSYACLPNDSLDHTIATQMQTLSEFRDRMTDHCFVGNDADDPTGRMDQAFEKVVAAADVFKKFQQAMREDKLPRSDYKNGQLTMAVDAGVLTEEEMKLLRESFMAQRDANAVDEFSHEELIRS